MMQGHDLRHAEIMQTINVLHEHRRDGRHRARAQVINTSSSAAVG
jgi:hypothetical protein